jgi:preprotein translocase subunit Sec61beta
MGIEKIQTKGVLGALVAVGIMVIIVVAVPAARWFLLITLPAGILVGVVLYLLHRQKQ